LLDPLQPCGAVVLWSKASFTPGVTRSVCAVSAAR